MQAKEIETLVSAGLAGCEVQVAGEGSSFQILVIGDLFEGKNAVKRQQAVYALLNEKIADGSVHAVTIKTYTRAEWAEQQ